MSEFFQRFRELFSTGQQAFVNVIDLLLVTYLVYRVLKLVRGTRVWRVVLGVTVFIAALVLSDFLELRTLHWVLDKATLLGPVALVILLLPELRQALEGFARLGLWPERLISPETAIGADALEEVVASAAEMAEQRIGALIVFERGTQLDDVVANGVPVHAVVTAPLLAAIFNEGSPLHDGAVVIRKGQVRAAACRLPLSENPNLEAHFHMRHRAGIGISEQSDCVALIVSEQRGAVSAAVDGKIVALPTIQHVRDFLNLELRGGLGKRRQFKEAFRGGQRSRSSVEKVG